MKSIAPTLRTMPHISIKHHDSHRVEIWWNIIIYLIKIINSIVGQLNHGTCFRNHPTYVDTNILKKG